MQKILKDSVLLHVLYFISLPMEIKLILGVQKYALEINIKIIPLQLVYINALMVLMQTILHGIAQLGVMKDILLKILIIPA